MLTSPNHTIQTEHNDSCPFSRENPVHFRQFSHDVSASLTSAIVDNVSSDDEKESHKPICPFGKECYRSARACIATTHTHTGMYYTKMFIRSEWLYGYITDWCAGKAQYIGKSTDTQTKGQRVGSSTYFVCVLVYYWLYMWCQRRKKIGEHIKV